MATATRKRYTDAPVARTARDVSKSASLEFLVYRDNRGDYHWEIVGGKNERLAHSGIFASYDEAEHAACCVYDGAGSARFAPHLAERRSPEAA